MLSSSYGTNITLGIKYDSATKKSGTFNHGIVCSKAPLPTDKFLQFEVHYQGSDVDDDDDQGVYEGCVQFGVTAVSPSLASGYPHACEHLKGLSFILADFNSNITCLFIGGKRVMEFPEVSLHSLSCAGVKISSDNSLHFFLNHSEAGESGIHIHCKLPLCLTPLPKLYGVIDLYGRCSHVKLVSRDLTNPPVSIVRTISEEDVRHVCPDNRGDAIESNSSVLNFENSSKQLPSSLISKSYSQVLAGPQSSSQQENAPPSGHQQCDVSPFNSSCQQPTYNTAKDSDFSQNPLDTSVDSFTQNPLDTSADNFTQSLLDTSVDSFTQNTPSVGVSGRPPSAAKSHTPCTSGYQDVCWRFLKEKAGLEDWCFDSEFHKCYCQSCSKNTKKTLKICGGMRYSVPPTGWFKFGLKLNNPARIEAKDLFKKGSKAYHGTQVSNLESIVEDSGRLLHPGIPLSDTERVEVPAGHYTNSWKPESHDTNQIFLSPSIKYATHKEVYAKTAKYTDPTTGKSYLGKVCLKVLVEPGVYKVSDQTVTTTDEQIDELFDNSELEWCVKSWTKIHIYGLLVRLELEHD